jgi:hypothetical protein
MCAHAMVQTVEHLPLGCGPAKDKTRLSEIPEFESSILRYVYPWYFAY